MLRDNRDQVVLLSLEQLRSRTQAKEFRDHLSAIDQRGALHRYEAALPSHEELRDRRGRFAGLTRPELAVLCAYTKIDLFKQLETCALPEDSYLIGRFLVSYFPASIAREFGVEIPRHGLRRELIVTRLVNELVDLMGASFVFRLTRSHGARTEDTVRAWIFAEGVLDLVGKAEGLRAGAAARERRQSWRRCSRWTTPHGGLADGRSPDWMRTCRSAMRSCASSPASRACARNSRPCSPTTSASASSAATASCARPSIPSNSPYNSRAWASPIICSTSSA